MAALMKRYSIKLILLVAEGYSSISVREPLANLKPQGARPTSASASLGGVGRVGRVGGGVGGAGGGPRTRPAGTRHSTPAPRLSASRRPHDDLDDDDAEATADPHYATVSDAEV